MEKTHLNKICPVERSGVLNSSLRRVIQNPSKILKPYINPGDKVLDFGCGPGFFTFDIARLVTESGLVYAADLQDGMLEKVRMKIFSSGLQKRIQVHKCAESAIQLNDTVDFILAFYMIHELVDQEKAFQEFKNLLNPNGKILIIEPDFHVTASEFQEMILLLEKTGFQVTERPKVFLSRSILLQRKL